MTPKNGFPCRILFRALPQGKIDYNRSVTEDKSALAGDAWGGLAASLVVLPQSIAFGVAVYAALGPAYAAYGALAGFLGAAAIGLSACVREERW